METSTKWTREVPVPDPGRAPLRPQCRFLLLGPVEVSRADGEPVHLGGSKPYGLLAMLLLARGVPVSSTELIDGLWPDGTSPRTASKMIQIYVSRIRQRLDEIAPGRLRTRPAGYLLEVRTGESDLAEFDTLRTRGRELLPTDPQRASASLGNALALWRGKALANVLSQPFAGPQAARLEEARLDTLEWRIDADLAAGRHRSMVSELQQLTAQNPLRERFTAQLMTALYRSGNQAGALGAARRLRTHLDDELGLHVGNQIDHLELAILRHAPELDPPEPPLTRTASSPPMTAQPPPPAGPQSSGIGSTSTTAPARRRLARRRLPMATRVARRRAVLGWGAVGVAAIVAVAVLVPGQRAQPTGTSVASAIRPNSLAVIDGPTFSVLADVRLSDRPTAVSSVADTAWVANSVARTVSAVDLRTYRVLQTYGLPSPPASVAAADNSVWITYGFHGTLGRISLTTNQILAPFFPDGRIPGLVPIAVNDQNAFLGLPDDRLLDLDASSMSRRFSVHLRDRVLDVAIAGQDVCVGYFRARALDCIDPRASRVVLSAVLPGSAIALAADDDGVWALAGEPARLWHVPFKGAPQPDGHSIPAEATAIAVDANYVWILYGEQGKLVRLPKADGNAATVTLNLGRPASSLTTWPGGVLVTVD